MNRKIKISVVLTLVFAFAVSTTCTVYAHPTKQNNVLNSEYHSEYGGYYVGGESVGWSIDEDAHNGGTCMNYLWKSDDACLTASRKAIVRMGAAKWEPCGTIEYSSGESYYEGGLIGTFDGGISNTVAKFYDYVSDSDGHLRTWKIDINWRKNATSTTLAHEFGHAWGLNDLYSSFNSNKLMYGYSTRTATNPTSTDIKGFNVITGLHTSHLFNTSGVCIVCGGLKKHTS